MKKTRQINRLPVNLVYDEMTSPIGQLTLIASEKELCAVLWDNDRDSPAIEKMLNGIQPSATNPILLETKRQLSDYFQGKRTTFDLPLAMHGTDFQIQVWQQLQKIPYANTITYGEQAKQVGDKNKARAVGSANGMNPLSIVVPCHRVIGSNGKLTGFAGGLDKKEFLLSLEKNNRNLHGII